MTALTASALRLTLRKLRAELHHTQEMNRVDANSLRKGVTKAKRIGREMQVIAKELRQRIDLKRHNAKGNSHVNSVP